MGHRTVGAWLGLVLFACGAETTEPGSDSSTHFFSRCQTNSDCQGGYSCECNRCTAACTSDEQCGEATCAPASSVLECALEGNVCAPNDAELGTTRGNLLDAGPGQGVPLPSTDTNAAAEPVMPTPALDASALPAPDVAVPGPSRDAGAPGASDAGLPAPMPVNPMPEQTARVDASSPTLPEPEPVSPCPGAPECEWVALPPLPAATRGHAAVELDGVVYVFGGGSEPDFQGSASEPYASTWAYDIDSAQWSPRAAMPVGAYMLTAHAVRGRILVQTGYGALGFVNALLAYDPVEDSWSELSPMPSYRYIFTTGVVDDRLYVIGGNGTVDDLPQGSQDWEYKDYVQVYDAMTDTWSSVAPEPEPTGGAASCTFGSRIYVFGGDTSNRTMIYDASSDAWSEGTPPPVARNAHACVTVGDAFYLLGGREYLGRELATVERYDPGPDTWTTLPDMPSGRQWFGATVVDSDVYVVGGQTDVGMMFDEVWLYRTEP